MIVGAVLGFAAVLAYYGGKILGTEDQFVRLAMLSGGTFLGIIFSRILSAGYANRKLREMYQKLYVETKPQEFIDLFTPRLAQVPDNLAEYMDGRVRLSFAEEALGHFDRALELLADLRPEELKQRTAEDGGKAGGHTGSQPRTVHPPRRGADPRGGGRHDGGG